MATPEVLRPVVVSATAAASYATEIRAGTHHVRADEPLSLGGTDTGPSPVHLLLGALASCTVITVRMYAARKAWDVGAVSADVEGQVDQTSRLVSAVVALGFTGSLDEKQRARLLEIAASARCTAPWRRGCRSRSGAPDH